MTTAPRRAAIVARPSWRAPAAVSRCRPPIRRNASRPMTTFGSSASPRASTAACIRGRNPSSGANSCRASRGCCRALLQSLAGGPCLGRGRVSAYILAGLGDSADSISHLQEARCSAAPVRRSLRADLGHARSKAMRRRPRIHARHPQPACCSVSRGGLRASDIKAGCGNAAPVRPSRPTSEGSRHDLRAVRRFSASEFRVLAASRWGVKAPMR
jgi:hypothetical protein